MTIKITNTPSMIQIFFRSGINFLNIRSDTNAITADKKQKTENNQDTSIPFCTPTCCLLKRISTASTIQTADTIFSGVSFIFNYLLFLNFFFFQAGCLLVLFLAAAAIAAACFFS